MGSPQITFADVQGELVIRTGSGMVKLNKLGRELKTFIPSKDAIACRGIRGTSVVGLLIRVQNEIALSVSDDDNVAILKFGGIGNQLKTGFCGEETHNERIDGCTHATAVRIDHHGGGDHI